MRRTGYISHIVVEICNIIFVEVSYYYLTHTYGRRQARTMLVTHEMVTLMVQRRQHYIPLFYILRPTLWHVNIFSRLHKIVTDVLNMYNYIL